MILMIGALAVAFFEGAGGLRAVELKISPPIVQRGSDVTLACLYELQGAPLYSVKWYRGRHEFYRHSPAETPGTKIFPFAGINVDLARSNETHVLLVRVSFGLSGNFSCEVTADAPSFATSIVSNQLEVVALPSGPPSLTTEHTRYSPGELLRATCSAPPSRPASTLTAKINDIEVTSGQLRTQQTADGVTLSELTVLLPLTPRHFERGPPLLTCTATVANGTLYSRQAELPLQLNGYPRIERVTSSAGTLEISAILTNIISFCNIVAHFHS